MIAQASYPGDPRIRREAEALEKAGCEIDVLCRPSGSQAKVEKFGNVTAYRITKAPSQENILKWIYYSSLFLIKSFWKIQFLYLKRRYNVIHVHNLPDFLVFAATFQKLLRVPVILDLHDLSVELFRSKWQNKKGTFLLSVIRVIEYFSCKFANHIITTSEGFAQRLISRGVPKEKITIIYNTPVSKHFYFNDCRKFSIINSNAVLLYHGTVSRRFGLDIAIKALPLIHKHVPGTRLIVFGKYEKRYKEELKRISQELNVDKYVELNDVIPIDKVLKEINLADFGLVPYVENEFMNLALSTKGFEYATAGLPVIASSLDPMKKIFDVNSVAYITPSDFNDLASKVVHLCKEPTIRKQMSINANDAIKGISWGLMEKRIYNLVNILVK